MRAVVTAKLINVSSTPTQWTGRSTRRVPLAFHSARPYSFASTGKPQEIGPVNPNRNKFTASEPRNEERDHDLEDLQQKTDQLGRGTPVSQSRVTNPNQTSFGASEPRKDERDRDFEDLQPNTDRTGYGTPLTAQVRDASRGQVKHEGMKPRDFPTDKVVDPVQTIREGTRVTHTYINFAEQTQYRDHDKSLAEKAGEQVANAASTLKDIVKEGWQRVAAGMGSADDSRSPMSKPGQDQSISDMAGIDRAGMYLNDNIKDASDQIKAKAEDVKEGWRGDKLTDRAKETASNFADAASRTTQSIKDDAKGAFQSWEKPRQATRASGQPLKSQGADNMKQRASKGADWVKEQLHDNKESGKSYTEQAKDAIKGSFAGKAAETIKDKATEAAKDAVKDKLTGGKPFEQGKKMAANAKDTIQGGIESGLKAAGLREENTIEKASRKIEEGASRAQEWARSSDKQTADNEYGQKLKETTQDLSKKAKETAQKFGEKAKEAVDSFNESKTTENKNKGSQDLK